MTKPAPSAGAACFNSFHAPLNRPPPKRFGRIGICQREWPRLVVPLARFTARQRFVEWVRAVGVTFSASGRPFFENEAAAPDHSGAY
jgi:hypothetical protein